MRISTIKIRASGATVRTLCWNLSRSWHWIGSLASTLSITPHVFFTTKMINYRVSCFTVKLTALLATTTNFRSKDCCWIDLLAKSRGSLWAKAMRSRCPSKKQAKLIRNLGRLSKSSWWAFGALRPLKLLRLWSRPCNGSRIWILAVIKWHFVLVAKIYKVVSKSLSTASKISFVLRKSNY